MVLFRVSHDKSYTLFRVGRRSSPEVKEFAEAGRWEPPPGGLDHFSGPPVPSGQGRTEAVFFADGNHSRVSVMSRIIPSPDWFVGLDSFQLCVDGNWLDTITIEVDPLDAGTDNGFTFTAPNWATEPQGVIYRITSRFPAHPAGSFYYPYIKHLPPIATFQFIKMREYETSEIFHHGEDDKKYEVVRSDQQNKINMMNGNEDIQEEIEEETKEQERLMQERTTTVSDNYIIPVPTAKPPRPLGPGIIRKGDTNAILNSIVETYHNQEGRLFKPTYKKSRLVRDCKVGEWGEWGGCSSSCGVGEMVRTRAVLRPARRGGTPCPPLTQARWCGSPTANCTQTTTTTW
nr:spondin-1 [Halyomorpha halys]